MAMVYIFIKTVLSTRVNGKRMLKKAKVKRSGKMAPNTREVTKLAARMVTVCTHGQMAACFKEVG